MKRLIEYLLLSSLLFGGWGVLVAQEDMDASHMPPKVLAITREYTKPGKAGTIHEKSESAFVQAMRAAQWPTHYIAADSLSGKSRSLFFTGYDSFEDMEKDALATQKNATLSAALDKASMADGELLTEMDMGDFTFNEEYSLRPAVDIPHMRYFDITVFQVRPGHEKDWDDLVKMYKAAYEKIPDGHWVTYQGVYGGPNGIYLVFVPMKSASEIDHSLAENKQFVEAMGPEGMKKLGELSAACIESSQSNLFVFNPRMSYVQDEWIKADPEFWSPKSMHMTASNKKEKSEPKK